ncbi:MAG TPA: hypothetical protein VED84_08625 [Acidimicrobiales bacterium]|nr:hypothetical protein [Acidimicrobiales bacterium]
MPTLWTPEGEHGVPDAPSQAAPTQDAAAKPSAAPSEEDLAAERATLERELAAAPAEDIVANHCFGLFQLAALYLTQNPPDIAKAKLAIDALGAVVDALGSRLGESTPTLQGALAQIRLAFVELSAKSPAAGPRAATPPSADGEAGKAP